MYDNQYNGEGERLLMDLRIRQLVKTHLKDGHLNLNGQKLENGGLRALARSEALQGVKSLSLRNNFFDHTGLAEIAASPHLKNLEALNLMDNAFKDKGMVALCEAPTFPGLKSLNVEGCGIKISGLKALALSSLKNLETLNISGNDLGDEAGKVLANCETFSGLKHF